MTDETSKTFMAFPAGHADRIAAHKVATAPRAQARHSNVAPGPHEHGMQPPMQTSASQEPDLSHLPPPPSHAPTQRRPVAMPVADESFDRGSQAARPGVQMHAATGQRTAGPQNAHQRQQTMAHQQTQAAAASQDAWFEAARAEARGDTVPLAAPVFLDQHESQGPTVSNPMPGFTVARADANGISLALPSHFAFYPFKDLYIVPFRNAHLAKLQRAHDENSIQQTIEVVSSVIYTTDGDHEGLAFDLTMPDFYFILYWLRFNSFTKSNYLHKTKCNNKEHVRRVRNGLNLHEYRTALQRGEITQEQFQEVASEILPPDSLNIAQIVQKSQINNKELESIPDPTVFYFEDGSVLENMVFRPPTMRDALEIMDSPLVQHPNTRSEFLYLAQQASHIQLDGGFVPIEQRIQLVENATADEAALINQYESMLSEYGIEEKVNVTCKVCGASRDTKMSLDASSFLSVK